MPKLKDYAIATRPWSFSMTAISVAMGTFLAGLEGPVSWGWFALALVGAVAFHAATNVLNDYFDTRFGVDQPDSPTAKYRPHPILGGLMSPGQLLIETGGLYVVALAVGIAAIVARSPHVAWIGGIGLLASVFYTAGPVKFKYRALGEVAVFLMWGPLMIGGAYVVQRQTLAFRPLLISVPFGVLVALVLFANNMRDIEYDARRGIKTLSILLGRKRSLAIYLGLIVAAYLALFGMVAARMLTPWALLVLLSVPKAVSLFRTFAREVPDAADAITAQLDTIFGACLMVGLFVAGLVAR
jgi:1,4-dihydroxy-2-naphthoate polyprenyltransferase